jgi:hypothetical protein
VTLAIFWIAALPTILIFLVAASTGSRLKTITATLVVAVAGALSGDPIYTPIDIGAAVIALVFCWIAILPAPRQKSGDEIRREQEQKVARQKTFQEFFVGLVVVGAIYFWETHKSPSQPIVQPITSAASATYPRCAGNPDIGKCEAFERQRNAETSAERSTSSKNFNDERARNMAIVNQARSIEHHKKAKTVMPTVAPSEIPYPIAYDPPGGTSKMTLQAPGPKVEPYVYDRGGHTGFPPECHWVSKYEWSCTK